MSHCQLLDLLAHQRAQEAWELGYQMSWVAKSFARAQQLKLQVGEIVFLKGVDHLNRHDFNCLVTSGHVSEKAFRHPVIVLKYSSGSTHAIVTTVSAYSSGDFNNNLPPWKQRCHSTKSRYDFRAFQGTERPGDKRPVLKLKDGKLMPKSKVSWVYAQNAFVVPITAIGVYDKSATRLCMTQQSLDDLRTHMLQFAHIRALGQDSRFSYIFENGAISLRVPLTTYPQISVISGMQKSSPATRTDKTIQDTSCRVQNAINAAQSMRVAVK